MNTPQPDLVAELRRLRLFSAKVVYDDEALIGFMREKGCECPSHRCLRYLIRNALVLVDRLEAAERALEIISDIVQCPCSIAERDSGHLVDCWMPELEELLAKLKGGA